jgi:hypothetical protein
VNHLVLAMGRRHASTERRATGHVGSPSGPYQSVPGRHPARADLVVTPAKRPWGDHARVFTRRHPLGSPGPAGEGPARGADPGGNGNPWPNGKDRALPRRDDRKSIPPRSCTCGARPAVPFRGREHWSGAVASARRHRRRRSGRRPQWRRPSRFRRPRRIGARAAWPRRIAPRWGRRPRRWRCPRRCRCRCRWRMATTSLACCAVSGTMTETVTQWLPSSGAAPWQ